MGSHCADGTDGAASEGDDEVDDEDLNSIADGPTQFFNGSVPPFLQQKSKNDAERCGGPEIHEKRRYRVCYLGFADPEAARTRVGIRDQRRD